MLQALFKILRASQNYKVYRFLKGARGFCRSLRSDASRKQSTRTVLLISIHVFWEARCDCAARRGCCAVRGARKSDDVISRRAPRASHESALHTAVHRLEETLGFSYARAHGGGRLYGHVFTHISWPRASRETDLQMVHFDTKARTVGLNSMRHGRQPAAPSRTTGSRRSRRVPSASALRGSRRSHL